MLVPEKVDRMADKLQFNKNELQFYYTFCAIEKPPK